MRRPIPRISPASCRSLDATEASVALSSSLSVSTMRLRARRWLLAIDQPKNCRKKPHHRYDTSQLANDRHLPEATDRRVHGLHQRRVAQYGGQTAKNNGPARLSHDGRQLPRALDLPPMHHVDGVVDTDAEGNGDGDEVEKIDLDPRIPEDPAHPGESHPESAQHQPNGTPAVLAAHERNDNDNGRHDAGEDNGFGRLFRDAREHVGENDGATAPVNDLTGGQLDGSIGVGPFEEIMQIADALPFRGRDVDDATARPVALGEGARLALGQVRNPEG